MNKEEINYWQIATILFGILAFCLICYGIVQGDLRKDYNPSKEIENAISDYAQRSILQFKFAKEGFNEKDVCMNIRGTPAWVDDSGVILSYGLKQIPNSPENMSVSIVQTQLIDKKIHFFYSDKCGWCHKQIELFGDKEWKRYQESNLTHDCFKILN